MDDRKLLRNKALKQSNQWTAFTYFSTSIFSEDLQLHIYKYHGLSEFSDVNQNNVE